MEQRSEISFRLLYWSVLDEDFKPTEQLSDVAEEYDSDVSSSSEEGDSDDSKKKKKHKKKPKKASKPRDKVLISLPAVNVGVVTCCWLIVCLKH